jgi:hypothetical protein
MLFVLSRSFNSILCSSSLLIIVVDITLNVKIDGVAAQHKCVLVLLMVSVNSSINVRVLFVHS